jgi:hypothetical protein
MEIEKGRVFNDLPTLKRWLQVFAVIRKRPYKVLHSHVERCYTVVCDKERCPWRICARKQKVSEKWKILHLFGSVLFPDGTGDTVPWMWIHCLTD